MLLVVLLTGSNLKKPGKDSYQRETVPARHAAENEP